MKNTKISTKNTDENPSFSRYLTVFSPIAGEVPSRDVIYQRTMGLVTQDISQDKLNHSIEMMLKMAGADRFLPPQYARFQTVVMEGAVFVLTHLPRERIVEKIVDQLMLPMDTPPGQRICTLVKDMPTLHKLSQIIGRSPGMDQEFKKFLVDLEDNVSTITFDTISTTMSRGLNNGNRDFQLTMEKKILAEASVCAVIPGTLSSKAESEKAFEHSQETPDVSCQHVKKDNDNTTVDGISGVPIVCKLVKPAVKKNMSAELNLWHQLGDFLDTHHEKWGLGDFQFKGTIDQVSWLLMNEMDLHLEQQNLDEVGYYYGSDASVLIPEKLSASTIDVTVMSRLDGTKITDVDQLTLKQRRTLAKKVTRLCILQPIIDLNRESLFHGDPHAGNIAYRFENDSPQIIFYDWAMVGRLNRLDRMAITLMISGLILENATVVYYAADILSGGKITDNADVAHKIRNLINDIIESRTNRIKGTLSSIEFLIEQIMYQGIVFPPDLLVFKKGLVSLKGVLADIDPTFERDEYVVWSAVAQLTSDIMHFRLQNIILKEIWMLYKSSFWLFLKIQTVLLHFGWEMVRAYALNLEQA